jgi:hypothetical protein
MRSQRQYLVEQLAAPHNRAKKLFRSRQFSRPLISILLVLILILAGSGVALAAESALPGSRLHPVKIVKENIEIVLTLDQVKEIQLHRQFAQQYLVAYANLVSQGQTQAAQIALQKYDQHTTRMWRLLAEFIPQEGTDVDHLQLEINHEFMQDVTILQSLLPGSF